LVVCLLSLFLCMFQAAKVVIIFCTFARNLNE
jgi:hypothetical protein